MFFKVGRVVSKSKHYIIFESNYTGYIIYVANPTDFEKDKVIRIYTHIHRNEFAKTYYGFKTIEARILFDDLITISGVGPKSAITLLRQGVKQVTDAIASQNVNFISNTPYIGAKTASMIIFELRDKYQNFQAKIGNKHMPNEIATTLKTLGFQKDQINYAISKLKPHTSIEWLVEEAIKLIANVKKSQTTKV